MYCSLAINISTLQIQYERRREMRGEREREREKKKQKDFARLRLYDCCFHLVSTTNINSLDLCPISLTYKHVHNFVLYISKRFNIINLTIQTFIRILQQWHRVG
jgi:hypothetical protein